MPNTAALKRTVQTQRQIKLLHQEVWFRLPAVLVMFLICGFFIGYSAIVLPACIFYISELIQYRASHRYLATSRRSDYWLLLTVSTVISHAALLPAISLWSLGELYAQQIAIIILMCALLHIVLLRSPHLPSGILSALPVSIAFYYLSYLQYIRSQDVYVFAISVVGVTTLSIYFLFAMVSYNRLQRTLMGALDTVTAASASKSRFLATMSHELRTPLNAIMGVSQLLREQPDHPATAVRVLALEKASRSLKELVDDVLDLTRIEQDQIDLRLTPADLAEEISAIVELYQPVALSKNLTFDFQMAENLSKDLIFDPLRVRQCVTNLLSNALKFTDFGSIKLTVSTHTLSDGNVLVQVEVRDTGIGVPKQMRHHLFQSGFQATARQNVAIPNRHSSGAGLGLAISRMLARKMDGDITFSPCPNAGARFRFTFVAQKSQHPAAPCTAPPLPNLQVIKHVLVVDDVATNRMVAAAFVEAMGPSTSQANSGLQALQQLAEANFDLVLLDMNMPGLSGLETFAAIRASDRDWANIPIIALTADAMPEDAARYLRAGLNGYLAKPLDRNALRAQIAALSTPEPAPQLIS